MTDVKLPDLEIGEYKHYKGNTYNVIGVGLDSETMQPVVIYKPLSDTIAPTDFWVRPYEMFIEEVTIDGKKMPRFQKL